MDLPIVIIGAGAAGLTAAIRAGELGASVLVLEKMPTAGRKILISGAGRCNLTNQAPLDQFIGQYFNHGRFLYPAFRRFFRPELIDLLKSGLVPVVTEPSGKVFPASSRSADVVQALYSRAVAGGVIFRFQEPALEIILEHDRAVAVRSSRGHFPAAAVILAAGGASWPSTGSSGDSYRFAEQIGYLVVPIRPALVPLIAPEPMIRSLSGLSCPNVGLKLMNSGRMTGKAEGDLLFTHFGLSGPAVLRLSRDFDSKQPADSKVEINLLPQFSQAELTGHLEKNLRRSPRRRLANVLGGELLPHALVLALLAITDTPGDLIAAQISRGRIEQIARTLQHLTLPVSGTRGFREAMVTAGGIDLREVDPRTMASKLVTGFYAAGEALDLDGDTGGFNLQAAFSTGWLAGDSAARLWQ